MPGTTSAHPDKARSAVPKDLAFTPVPRQKDRSNGWKPEVQRAFIQALAETGSVRAACRRAGRSEHGAYAMRNHPQGAGFAAAWQAALDLGIQKIEDVAMDRALNGVEVPVYAYGNVIGTRTVFNDRLLMFLLRNRAPDRFAGAKAGGLSALDKQTLARLKEQWRREWAREEHEDEQEVLASIDKFIENMAANRRDNMSPRARAAYEEWQRIKEEDATAWMLDAADGEDDDEAADEPPPGLPAPTDPPSDEATKSDRPDGRPSGPRIWTTKGEWD